MRILIVKPIVLIGMVGSGKSTIGKKLAKKLNIQFYDSDKLIENNQNLSVTEIYDFKGEDYFKSQEVKVIKEVLHYKQIILATGGSSFMNEEIRNLIKKHAISIWLYTDLDILYNRVIRRNTRPELNQGDKMEILKQMIQERHPIYEQADITVPSNTENVYQIIDEILIQLRKYSSDN